MTKSADHTLVRNTNQRVVLDAIFNSGPTSRAALARQLSMSKPAISDNLAPLLALSIVQEVAEPYPPTLGSGRRPILIKCNKTYTHFFAIDLNYKDPIFAIANMSGEIIDHLCVEIAAEATFETRMSLVENAIKLMWGANNLSAEDFYCIGISSPGVFGSENDLHSFRSNRIMFGTWFKENMVDVLSRKFSLPVFIKNDANTGAVGELLFGAGKEVDQLLYICCGEGVGGGVILDGKLYEGPRFLAGDFSNFVDEQRLQTGKTIEGDICIEGVLHNIATAIENGAESCLADISDRELSFQDVVEAYKKKDELVLNILQGVAQGIACLALSAGSLLDVPLVVLGGEYVAFQELIVPFVQKVFDQYQSHIKICISALNRHAGLYGVFGIARNLLFEDVSAGNKVTGAGRSFI